MQLTTLLFEFVISFIILYIGILVYQLYRYPKFHIWPSVTRCQICKKRLYVWNRGERIYTDIQIPESETCSIKVSSMVHKKCAGIGSPDYEVKFKTQ